MNLEELKKSADLSQRLLIDKVLDLVAADIKKAEDNLKEAKERERWNNFMLKRWLDCHKDVYQMMPRFQYQYWLDNTRKAWEAENNKTLS
jgi:hypothetical protein